MPHSSLLFYQTIYDFIYHCAKIEQLRHLIFVNAPEITKLTHVFTNTLFFVNVIFLLLSDQDLIDYFIQVADSRNFIFCVCSVFYKSHPRFYNCAVFIKHFTFLLPSLPPWSWSALLLPCPYFAASVPLLLPNLQFSCSCQPLSVSALPHRSHQLLL